MMPNRQTIHISALYGEQEDEIPGATCGDQIRVRLRGIEEEDILPVSALIESSSPNRLLTLFS
jgi:peptide chain release factor subunit 3